MVYLQFKMGRIQNGLSTFHVLGLSSFASDGLKIQIQHNTTVPCFRIKSANVRLSANVQFRWGSHTHDPITSDTTYFFIYFFQISLSVCMLHNRYMLYFISASSDILWLFLYSNIRDDHIIIYQVIRRKVYYVEYTVLCWTDHNHCDLSNSMMLILANSSICRWSAR